MRPEDYLDFISPDEIRLKGHRIWIEHVLAYYVAGETAATIASHLDTLRDDEIQAVIAYYEAHRPEIDEYLRRLDTAIEEQMRQADAAPAPVVDRLRRLRAHLAQSGRPPETREPSLS